jgi:PAS domain S-box-containing protein
MTSITHLVPPELTLAFSNVQPSMEPDDHRGLAQAIVDTISEPLLVLDKDLRVVSANRSFYLKFGLSRQDVQGRPVSALGGGRWNIPALLFLLENVTEHTVMEDYEVEQDITDIEPCTMLLSARKVFYEDTSHATILVSFEDITERRAKERELRELLTQKDLLLLEIQHRVANSLQIIASILLIKARTVQSEEIRAHLKDAHRRVVSIAALQQQLQAVAEPGEALAVGPYLSRLCEVLSASMIADNRPVALTVHAQGGTATSNQAMSIGLIVTELVINAFKYAFPIDRPDAAVHVTYEVADANWKLIVSDNGIGKLDRRQDTVPGLGTAILEALAKQLDAKLNVVMDARGTTVSITHALEPARLTALG